MYLKKLGYVKVFRRTFKNESDRYYIMYLPDLDVTKQLTRMEFNEFHSIHWGLNAITEPSSKCVEFPNLW
jgi:hypothetical protein